jgi:hypothetical protein
VSGCGARTRTAGLGGAQGAGVPWGTPAVKMMPDFAMPPQRRAAVEWVHRQPKFS